MEEIDVANPNYENLKLWWREMKPRDKIKGWIGVLSSFLSRHLQLLPALPIGIAFLDCGDS